MVLLSSYMGEECPLGQVAVLRVGDGDGYYGETTPAMMQTSNQPASTWRWDDWKTW